MLEPGVTVVAQNPYEMGRIAARRAFARLDGDVGDPARIVVPSVLIPRGSGEIPPAPR
jgi:LacI family transcriptional regulator